MVFVAGVEFQPRSPSTQDSATPLADATTDSGPIIPSALTHRTSESIAAQWSGESYEPTDSDTAPQGVPGCPELVGLFQDTNGVRTSQVICDLSLVDQLLREGLAGVVVCAAYELCGGPIQVSASLVRACAALSSSISQSQLDPTVLLLSSCTLIHPAGSSGSADLSEDAPVRPISTPGPAADAQAHLIRAEEIISALNNSHVIRTGDVLGPVPFDILTRASSLAGTARGELTASQMHGGEAFYMIDMRDIAQFVSTLLEGTEPAPGLLNLFAPTSRRVGYTVGDILAHVTTEGRVAPPIEWPEGQEALGPTILTNNLSVQCGFSARFGLYNGRVMEIHPLQQAAAWEHMTHPPVWLMRQAGRYLPEYKSIMEGKQFFNVIENPPLAAEITLQPVLRYGLDAAIIFTDILIIPQAMGMHCTMIPGKGPTFSEPIREPSDLDKLELNPCPRTSSLRFALEGIRESVKLLHQLPDRPRSSVTQIGFCGAPWTLFVYMIEGSSPKGFAHCKRWIYKYPQESHRLLASLTEICAAFLVEQVDAGAQALEVFDSHAAQLPPAVYREFALPGLLRIAELVKAARPEVTLMALAKEADHVLADLNESQYDVVALGQMSDAKLARSVVSAKALMGNVDPGALFADEAPITRITHEALDALGGESAGRGVIANLGHGVDMLTPVEGVSSFVNAVRSWAPKRTIVIGSRKSQLAMVQAVWVRDTMAKTFPETSFVIKEVVSTGDKILGVPLSKIGDTGLFTKQLEMELLSHSIDIAVHSLKDVETALPPGLLLTAYSEREDPSDLLVINPERPQLHGCTSIASLPQGAVVGTSSLRRQVQLRRIRPDLQLEDIRGNVQLRIKKLREGFDAVIMAAAGFHRLGLLEDPEMQPVCHPVSSDEMLYAVGQAALAIECCEADLELRRMVREAINHDDTEIRVCAEREFLRALGGGCQVPLGVASSLENGEMQLTGAVFSLDGQGTIHGQVKGAAGDALGLELAEKLNADGAAALITEVRAIRKAEGHTY